jgi:uncharacterized coiled-coil protein SlyX
MVHLRSGKNTNVYESRVHECGHMCGSSMVYCCACNDIRPVQATYVAHNRSNLFEVSYVSRSHYYCPVCKQKPSPVKIDFSKMKRKPASDPALFQPTTEYKLAETEKKLAEAEKKLAETEKKLAETNESITCIVERLSNPFKSAISRPNF